MEREEESFILINSYLPVDNRNNVNEVLQTLASINSIIEDHSPCHTIWTGDLNGDFSRSTPHAECLKSYIQEKGLHNLWDQFHVDYTCYYDYDEWSCSTIDHFIVNHSVKQKIVSAGNIVHPNNTSDHTPIYCELALNSVNEVPRNTDKPQSSKPSWSKSSIEEKEAFKAFLNVGIKDLKLSENPILSCRDVNCSDQLHKSELDDITMQFLATIQNTAEDILSKPNLAKVKKNSIPGWLDYVKPAKDDAVFWNSVWISCGKPIGTEVHNIMKRTRNKIYLFACKLVNTYKDT